MTEDQETPEPGAPAALLEHAAKSGINYSALLECIHCGLCLSSCPTFDLLGTEGDSPRGRIYLMRALAEGRAEINPSLVHHLDTCLGCRACETACPSAVHYAELLGQTRARIEKEYPRPTREKFAKRTLLNTLTSPARLSLAMTGAKLAGKLTRSGDGVPAFLSRFLSGKDGPLGEMPLPAPVPPLPRRLPAFTPSQGERRARVAVLSGCVMSVLFHHVNEATVRVLAANGCDVIVPPKQGCCGALHVHGGFADEARQLARQMMDVFERENFDALIVNSAGCGSTMKEYAELFPQGVDATRAKAFREKVMDVSEFLAKLGLRPITKERRARVAYHDACHLAHGQGIRAQPRALLAAIPGLELVPVAESDWCCGSAGIYNFMQPHLATQLQSRKVANLLAARPDLIVTGNPGCHMWILAGLKASGKEIPVKHTVEVLDEAYAG
jgi:glycolate dehydrogenase iron-sulfur subunit